MPSVVMEVIVTDHLEHTESKATGIALNRVQAELSGSQRRSLEEILACVSGLSFHPLFRTEQHPDPIEYDLPPRKFGGCAGAW